MTAWLGDLGAFVIWILPGQLFSLAVCLTWILAVAVARGIHRLRTRRHAWTIRDLEHLANNPHHPRYADIPARKETS